MLAATRAALAQLTHNLCQLLNSAVTALVLVANRQQQCFDSTCLGYDVTAMTVVTSGSGSVREVYFAMF
jgi:hypothetical protein